jgi:hypothetical protein
MFPADSEGTSIPACSQASTIFQPLGWETLNTLIKSRTWIPFSQIHKAYEKAKGVKIDLKKEARRLNQRRKAQKTATR